MPTLRRLLAAAAGVTVTAVIAAPGPALTHTAAVGVATCGTATPTQSGTDGPDELTGTPGNDVIFGLGGDDVISGLEGNDLLCGGQGSDTLDGGPGDDRLFGQADEVHLSGESDHVHWGDTLRGGPGSDLLDPGADSEPEYAKPETLDFSDLSAAVRVDLSANTVVSDVDTDTIAHFGGVLEDRLVIGTAFDDTMIGTRNDDILVGGDGDDRILAGHGGDRLVGGDGDDRLFGGPDHDSRRDPYEPQSYGDDLTPGAGDDLVSTGGKPQTYSQNSISFIGSPVGVRVDVAARTAVGEGSDTLRLRGGLTVVGSRHNDVVKGTVFRDVLAGAGGDDRLFGRAASDDLYGDGSVFVGVGHGRGTDSLYGGNSRDFLDGGPLADGLYGGLGRDFESDRPNINTCHGIEDFQRGGC